MCVSVMSLNGGSEKPLQKDVNVEDAKVMGYLPRKAGDRVWKHPKEEKCVIVIKARKSCISEQHTGKELVTLDKKL